MFVWIAENIWTIIICAALILIVASIIVGLVKNKKKVNHHADAIVLTAQWQAPATPAMRKSTEMLREAHSLPHIKAKWLASANFAAESAAAKKQSEYL